MKKVVMLLSVVVLCGTSFGAAALVNGGFEDATVDPWLADATGLSINTTTARSGSQSLQVDFPDYDLSGIHQFINVAPSDAGNYTLDFSVNMEGYGELFGILPAVMEWNGVDPGTWMYGTYEWINAGTLGWSDFSQEFALTKTDSVLYQVQFYLYPQGDPKVAGSMLMDDISLVPEPTTMALLGLGGLLLRRRRA